MNKFVTSMLTALFLFLGSLLLPHASTAQAKMICECDLTTENAIFTTDSAATLASRSGMDPIKKKNSVDTYIVKRGDTLSQIAIDYDTDIDTLIALNDIHDPRTLQIGQKLTLPQKGVTQKELPALMSIDKVMNFHLTAYTAGPESTGKSPGHPLYGITSTGKRATEGRTIAVDPKVIPYGSKVYIEGVGIRTAEDTGGAIVGNRIDVYIENLQQALEFGYKKNVRVYILSSPNA